MAKAMHISYRTFTVDEMPFLNDIHAAPRDFTARRVYGDWLQDRGDPLGEFIRLQILEYETGYNPPRGTKTRIRKLEQEHGASWRGAPTNRHRRFESGGFFSSFVCGLPHVSVYVPGDLGAWESLERAYTHRRPHHQLEIIMDIEHEDRGDISPLLSHPVFKIAHSVELRTIWRNTSNGTFLLGPIGESHLRQALRCFDQRVFRRRFFRDVPDGRVEEVERSLLFESKQE